MTLSKKKILLGPSSFAERDRQPLEKLLASGCEVIHNPYGRKLTKPELLQCLKKDVTGIIAGLEPLDKEVLEKSNLKVISRCGSGMSNVDLEAAKKLGIKVFSTPNGPITAVAELTLGCLLTLLRRVPRVNQSLHERKWDKQIGRQLEGKKVAVVGWGRIGRKVGQLLLAFGAEVMAVDPLYQNTDPQVKKMELPAALAIADVITLHCSGHDRVLGKQEFALMKNGAYLLNAARGELIDEEELLKALNSGKMDGVWLDTFLEEPYRGPLCDHPDILLTAHIGSYTEECRRTMEIESVENLLHGFSR